MRKGASSGPHACACFFCLQPSGSKSAAKTACGHRAIVRVRHRAQLSAPTVGASGGLMQRADRPYSERIDRNMVCNIQTGVAPSPSRSEVAPRGRVAPPGPDGPSRGIRCSGPSGVQPGEQQVCSGPGSSLSVRGWRFHGPGMLNGRTMPGRAVSWATFVSLRWQGNRCKLARLVGLRVCKCSSN